MKWLSWRAVAECCARREVSEKVLGGNLWPPLSGAPYGLLEASIAMFVIDRRWQVPMPARTICKVKGRIVKGAD